MVALFVFSFPLVPTHLCTFWESIYYKVIGLLYDRLLPPCSHVENLVEGSGCVVLISVKNFGDPGGNGKDLTGVGGFELEINSE